LFRPAFEASGMPTSLINNRQYLLEVNSSVNEGRLLLNWTYSQKFHYQRTIATLAEGYLKALRKIVSHCQALKSEGYTPSDFPKAQLSQKALDQFIAKLTKKRKD